MNVRFGRDTTTRRSGAGEAASGTKGSGAAGEAEAEAGATGAREAGEAGASWSAESSGAAGSAGSRAAFVILFAAAMAWMEAATVLYLRTLVDRVDPYQVVPFPESFGWAWVELVREAATMVMLVAVAMLAGRGWRDRFGYWLIAFGTWDILYYVVLAAVSPWPRSLFDWDLLFLLPLPWWGPVWAPAAIAMLMVATGALIVRGRRGTVPLWPGGRAWLTGSLGVGLALFVFMTDAIGAIDEGPVAVRQVLPERFEWRIFLIALGLMAVLPGSLLRGTLARTRTRSRASRPSVAGMTDIPEVAGAADATGAAGVIDTSGSSGAARETDPVQMHRTRGRDRPLGPEFRVSCAGEAGMRICTDIVRLRTESRLQFIDLTEVVEERVRRSGIRQGLVLVQARHTTAAIVVNENEPLLHDDLGRLLERLAPCRIVYRHDDFGARRAPVPPGERPNGHSHARAVLLGHEGSLCIAEGRIQLGSWQRIFLVELDGGREREVTILALGCAG